MSFCTNCGTKLEDGAKFCHGCGAPVEQTEPQQEPAAWQTAPQPEPQPNQQSTYLNGAPMNAAQQEAEQQLKKQFRLTKGIIAIGAAVVAVLAIVLVLVMVVFPSFGTKEVDVKEYITFNFTGKEFVDGFIEGDVKLDTDKMYKDIVGDSKDKMSQSRFEDRLAGFVFINNEDYEYGKTYNKNDTIKVKLDWYVNSSFEEPFKDFEKDMGVKFKDTESGYYTLKLSQQIKSAGITVEDPVNIDPISELKKLTYSTGFKDYGVKLHFKDGEYKVNDTYTLKLAGDNKDEKKAYKISVKKDGKEVVKLSYGTGYYSGKKGEEVEFSINSYDENLRNIDSDYTTYMIKGTPLIIKTMKGSVKLKGDKGLTAAEAKKHLSEIKKVAKKNYDNKKFSVKKVVFLKPKKSTYWKNRVVVFGKDTSQKSYPLKYVVLNDCYLSGGKFNCTELESDRFYYYTVYSKKLDAKTLKSYLDASNNNIITVA